MKHVLRIIVITAIAGLAAGFQPSAGAAGGAAATSAAGRMAMLGYFAHAASRRGSAQMPSRARAETTPINPQAYRPTGVGVQIAEIGRPPSMHTVHGKVAPLGVVAMMVEHSAAKAAAARAMKAPSTIAPTTVRFTPFMAGPPCVSRAAKGRLERRSTRPAY